MTRNPTCLLGGQPRKDTLQPTAEIPILKARYKATAGRQSRKPNYTPRQEGFALHTNSEGVIGAGAAVSGCIGQSRLTKEAFPLYMAASRAR